MLVGNNFLLSLIAEIGGKSYTVVNLDLQNLYNSLLQSNLNYKLRNNSLIQKFP